MSRPAAPAGETAQAVPAQQVRQASDRRHDRLVMVISLGLCTCMLLGLLFIIAFVHEPQIGRALESTILARTTQAAPGTSEPTPVFSPTLRVDAPHAGGASPTPTTSPTPSPPATLVSTATLTASTATTATLEPGPTPRSIVVTPWPTATPIPVPTGAPPTRLVIPSIQLDTPVRPVGPVTVLHEGKEMVIWDTLRDVASFHETAAYPGTGGNIVINGHRDIYGSVFLYLNKVRRGDEVILYVDDLVYRYAVVDILKLPYVNASPEQMAEHLRLLGSTNRERVTILTCTPVGKATHRLYVLAEPLSGDRYDLSTR